MHDIEKFLQGFQQFQSKYFADDHALFDELRQGQHPTTLVIACCDSRADPALLLGCDPGDIFVVRNIANLVPPCDSDHHYHGVSAAIQFAVLNLAINRVIVLGHSQCGGIRALFSDPIALAHHNANIEAPDFVSKWLSIAAPAKMRVLQAHCLHPLSIEQQHHAAEMASIINSLHNLLSYPWLKQAVEQQKLSLHGWYFNLQEGALYAYSARADQFLAMVSGVNNTNTVDSW